MLTYITSKGLSDAQIQLTSGHKTKKNLEVYQHLSLQAVESAYQEAVQRSMGSMGPSVPEKNSAHSVFLSSGHEPGFVDGMGIRFRSGEETRPHHDAVGTQAECSRQSSCVGNTPGGQDRCGWDRIHDARQKHHGRNLTGHITGLRLSENPNHSDKRRKGHSVLQANSYKRVETKSSLSKY
jgi:hypothetical protein